MTASDDWRTRAACRREDPTLCVRTDCTRKASHGGGQYCRSHYQRRLRMGLAGFVDSAPTIAHLDALRDVGWTFEQIGQAAGLHPAVPAVLLRHRYGRVRQRTAKALLGVAVAKQSSRRSIDSTGSRRRVQALAWMGWNLDEVARRAGMTKSVLMTVYRPRVSHAVARKIEQVYELLSHLPGPSKPAQARARSCGHAPPAAWDEDTIDDPIAKPDLGDTKARGRADLAVEARHLLGFGLSLFDVAKRLDVSVPYVRAVINETRAAA